MSGGLNSERMGGVSPDPERHKGVDLATLALSRLAQANYGLWEIADWLPAICDLNPTVLEVNKLIANVAGIVRLLQDGEEPTEEMLAPVTERERLGEKKYGELVEAYTEWRWGQLHTEREESRGPYISQAVVVVWARKNRPDLLV